MALRITCNGTTREFRLRMFRHRVDAWRRVTSVVSNGAPGSYSLHFDSRHWRQVSCSKTPWGHLGVTTTLLSTSGHSAPGCPASVCRHLVACRPDAQLHFGWNITLARNNRLFDSRRQFAATVIYMVFLGSSSLDSESWGRNARRRVESVASYGISISFFAVFSPVLLRKTKT